MSPNHPSPGSWPIRVHASVDVLRFCWGAGCLLLNTGISLLCVTHEVLFEEQCLTVNYCDSSAQFTNCEIKHFVMAAPSSVPGTPSTYLLIYVLIMAQKLLDPQQFRSSTKMNQ